jgi:tetratricopeptide (TPR) repeat protein
MRFDKRFFELSGIKVTDEPIIQDNDKPVLKQIEYWGRKIRSTNFANQSSVNELKNVIEKHPDVPAFKNYLFTCLSLQKRYDEAQIVLEDTLAKHPDYSFAKINKATDFIRIGNLNKAASMLVEPYDVRNIDKSEFIHESLFRSYYAMALDVEYQRGNLEKAEAMHRILFEYNKNDTLVESLANKIIELRFRTNPLFNKPENLQEVEPISKPLQKSFLSDNEGNPVFNHPEVKDFYKYSLENIPRDVVEKILLLPRTTLIQDLEYVFLDMVLRWDYFCETDHEDDTHNFGIHALYFLTELRAYKSLESILDIFRQDEEICEYWFSDSIDHFFLVPLYILGEKQLDVLKAFVLEKNLLSWHRSRATDAMAQIALQQPERRTEIVDCFRDILTVFIKNPNDKSIIDSLFLGSMMWDLTIISAVELEEEVRNIFDIIPVDISISGDFNDIMEDMQAPTRAEDVEPLPNDIFELYNEEYRKRRVLPSSDEDFNEFIKENDPHKNYLSELSVNTMLKAFKAKSGNGDFDFDDDEDDEFEDDDEGYYYKTPPQETVKREEPKVGRNDPCPCGSGKKYKKCHGK